MSIESVIKQELSGTRHSTVLVSERKLVKRLVLKQFQGAIDLLMHISGSTNIVPAFSLIALNRAYIFEHILMPN